MDKKMVVKMETFKNKKATKMNYKMKIQKITIYKRTN